MREIIFTVSDDDPAIVSSVAEIIKITQAPGEHYQIQKFNNGIDTWEFLQNVHAPVIAIIDLRMPGYGGFEICEMIHDLEYHIHIFKIILTGTSEKDVFSEAFLKYDVDLFVSKGGPNLTQTLISYIGLGKRNLAIRELCSEDEVTGLSNRKDTKRRLRAEIARWNRKYDRHVGIMLGDLDHFKRINDAYGHSAGDAVLREFSERVKNHLRPFDIVGRWGGEEFCIVLPNSNLVATAHKAEEVRRLIAKETFKFQGNEIPVTASFGVTATDFGFSVTDTADLVDQMLSRADACLYIAKRQGRNQVSSCAEP